MREYLLMHPGTVNLFEKVTPMQDEIMGRPVPGILGRIASGFPVLTCELMELNVIERFPRYELALARIEYLKNKDAAERQRQAGLKPATTAMPVRLANWLKNRLFAALTQMRGIIKTWSRALRHG